MIDVMGLMQGLSWLETPLFEKRAVLIVKPLMAITLMGRRILHVIIAPGCSKPSLG